MNNEPVVKQRQLGLKRDFRIAMSSSSKSGEQESGLAPKEERKSAFQGLSRPIKPTEPSPQSAGSSLKSLGEEEDFEGVGDIPGGYADLRVGLENKNPHFQQVIKILRKDKELEPLIQDHKILLETLKHILGISTEQMLSIISAAEKEAYENSKHDTGSIHLRTYERSDYDPTQDVLTPELAGGIHHTHHLDHMDPMDQMDLILEAPPPSGILEPPTSGDGADVDMRSDQRSVHVQADLLLSDYPSLYPDRPLSDQIEKLENENFLLTQKLDQEVIVRRNLEDLFEREGRSGGMGLGLGLGSGSQGLGSQGLQGIQLHSGIPSPLNTSEVQLLKMENEELRRVRQEMDKTVEEQGKYMSDLEKLQSVIIQQQTEKENLVGQGKVLEKEVRAKEGALDLMKKEMDNLEREKDELSKKLSLVVMNPSLRQSTVRGSSGFQYLTESKMEGIFHPRALTGMITPTPSTQPPHTDSIYCPYPPPHRPEVPPLESSSPSSPREARGGPSTINITHPSSDMINVVGDNSEYILENRDTLENINTSLENKQSFESPMHIGKDLAALMMVESQGESSGKGHRRTGGRGTMDWRERIPVRLSISSVTEENKESDSMRTGVNRNRNMKSSGGDSGSGRPSEILPYRPSVEQPIGIGEIKDNLVSSVLEQNVMQEDTFRRKDILLGGGGGMYSVSDGDWGSGGGSRSLEGANVVQMSKLQKMIGELKRENSLLTSKLQVADDRVQFLSHRKGGSSELSRLMTKDEDPASASQYHYPQGSYPSHPSPPYLRTPSPSANPSILNMDSTRHSFPSRIASASHPQHSAPAPPHWERKLEDVEKKYNTKIDEIGQMIADLSHAYQQQSYTEDRDTLPHIGNIPYSTGMGVTVEEFGGLKTNIPNIPNISQGRGVSISEKPDEKMEVIKQLVQTLTQNLIQQRDIGSHRSPYNRSRAHSQGYTYTTGKLPLETRENLDFNQRLLAEKSKTMEMQDCVSNLTMELTQAKMEMTKLRREKLMDDQSQLHKEMYSTQNQYMGNARLEYDRLLSRYQDTSSENIDLKMRLGEYECSVTGDYERVRKYLEQNKSEVKAQLQAQFFDYKLKVDEELLKYKEKSIKLEANLGSVLEQNDRLNEDMQLKRKKNSEMEYKLNKYIKKNSFMSSEMHSHNQTHSDIGEERERLHKLYIEAKRNNEDLEIRLRNTMHELREVSRKYYHSEKKRKQNEYLAVDVHHKSMINVENMTPKEEHMTPVNKEEHRLHKVIDQQTYQLQKYSSERKAIKRKLEFIEKQVNEAEMREKVGRENFLNSFSEEASLQKEEGGGRNKESFTSYSTGKQYTNNYSQLKTPLILDSPTKLLSEQFSQGTPFGINSPSSIKVAAVFFSAFQRRKMQMLSFLHKWKFIVENLKVRESIEQEFHSLHSKQISPSKREVIGESSVGSTPRHIQMEKTLKRKENKLLEMQEKNRRLYLILSKCIRSVNERKAFKLNLEGHGLGGGGMELILPALKQNAFLLEINLNSNRLTNLDLANISQFLASDTKMRSICLANNSFDSHGIDQFLPNLSQMKLVAVDLSHNNLRGGLEAIGNFLLGQPRLEEIRLKGIYTVKDTGNIYTSEERIFYNSLSKLPKLRKLDLSSNTLRIKQILPNIITYQYLSCLKLNHIQMSTEEGRILEQFLDSKPNLSNLHISHTGLSPISLSSILQKIITHQSLSELNISGHKSNTTLLQKLSILLKVNLKLSDIYLNDMGLTDAYMSLLMDSLAQAMHIRSLSIERNLFSDQFITLFVSELLNAGVISGIGSPSNIASGEGNNYNSNSKNNRNNKEKDSLDSQLSSEEGLFLSASPERKFNKLSVYRTKGFIHISMEGNRLTDVGAKALGKLVMGDSVSIASLGTLNLCATRIGELGVAILLQALEHREAIGGSKLQILLDPIKGGTK